MSIESNDTGGIGGRDALDTKVIANGLCIGCGACAASSIAYGMQMTPDGFLQARRDPKIVASDRDLSAVDQVCPFSDQSKNEDAIAELLFEDCPEFDAHLGRYRSLHVGNVADPELHARGSSGGVGRWLLARLLEEGLIDYAVQVYGNEAKAGSESSLFGYRISSHPDEVLQGSKSAYYPVSMEDALKHIRRKEGRYAITGVPCFIKAVRLLALQDETIRRRVRFTIGLICGHLKSANYAAMLAWQMGVPPEELSGIDFRGKNPKHKANEKGITVRGRKTDIGPEKIQLLFGGNYNLGFFQYKACDYCDDVVAETADISIGDAWLPEYIRDGRGTSVVIVRNAELEKVVGRAIESGDLALKPLSAMKMIESQAGGFRQRREGLSYRLFLANQRGEWSPPKRVRAQQGHVSGKRRAIYRLRMNMWAESSRSFIEALRRKDFQYFRERMQPLINENGRLNQPGLMHKLMRRCKRIIARCTSK